MATKDEHLEPLRVLRKRLEEMAEELHIEINTCAAMIGPDPGDPDVLQVVFALTKDALKSADELEQTRIDDEFERMMAGETFIDKAADVTTEPLDLWDDDA